MKICSLDTRGDGVRIFIVEDSDPIKMRLITSLSDIESVEVVGDASSERDAVQGILAKSPDAAILDIQLRGGNGMNVLHEVKRQLPELKVIVLTNFSYPQYRQRCLQEGADYFLDKSSEFMSVERIVADWANASGCVA